MRVSKILQNIYVDMSLLMKSAIIIIFGDTDKGKEVASFAEKKRIKYGQEAQ